MRKLVYAFVAFSLLSFSFSCGKTSATAASDSAVVDSDSVVLADSIDSTAVDSAVVVK